MALDLSDRTKTKLREAGPPRPAFLRLGLPTCDGVPYELLSVDGRFVQCVPGFGFGVQRSDQSGTQRKG
jgi:hypothetical protein